METAATPGEESKISKIPKAEIKRIEECPLLK